MRRMRRVRRLSMTSLIDVIFLLLLFFMLSTTFTRFAEVDLAGGGASAAAGPPDAAVFVQVSAAALRLNGRDQPLDGLEQALAATARDGGLAIVAVAADVTAQRLSDLLVALRALPGLRVTVLEGA